MRRLLFRCVAAAWAVFLIAAAWSARRRQRGRRLWWGSEPLVGLQYLSDALRADGYDSTTVVDGEYPIFRRTRFDRYYEAIASESRLPRLIARRSVDFLAFLELVRGYDIAHFSFKGGPLGRTPLATMEPWLLRLARIRTVIVPYGADFWRYSWIPDSRMRHAMLLDYPEAGRREDLVDRRVKRWMRHADIVVMGVMLEGASRWDVLATNFLVVPPERFRPRERRETKGPADPVTIVHAPNHRGVKGTEFIVDAVESLQCKGYPIEFVLLEGVPNEDVLAAMRRADVCLDHCTGSGYGLFAMEAMGSGSVVMANLEDELGLSVHRSFGWLDQCPIVSANVEQLEETLEHLILHPELRVELGQMGIEYVRRFHSPEMAQHLFGSVYRKLAGDDVDLLRLFHPKTSSYMQRFDPLRPPLRRNRPLELS